LVGLREIRAARRDRAARRRGGGLPSTATRDDHARDRPHRDERSRARHCEESLPASPLPPALPPALPLALALTSTDTLTFALRLPAAPIAPLNVSPRHAVI